MTDIKMIGLKSYIDFKAAFMARAKSEGVVVRDVVNCIVRPFPPQCSSTVGIKTDSVDDVVAILEDMGYPGASHHIIYNIGHVVCVDICPDET